MADITVNYKGDAIAEISASGTKTLKTEGKYCEDDIELVYVKPGGSPSGTKQINITQNGTTTEDVAQYASAEINVNVSGGGGSGALSGTFTVAENTLSVTIADLIGTNLSHIIVKAAGYINDGLVANLRTMLFAYLDYSTSSSVNIGSNSAGTSTSMSTTSALSSSSKAFLDRSTGVFTMSDSTNGGGYMAAGVTYEWFAW